MPLIDLLLRLQFGFKVGRRRIRRRSDATDPTAGGRRAGPLWPGSLVTVGLGRARFGRPGPVPGATPAGHLDRGRHTDS